MAGNIVHLRVEPRSCEKCVNALFGANGIYCTEYQEYIWNERKAASDCPLYEEFGTQEAVIIGLREG